jgi:hypothetical protein
MAGRLWRAILAVLRRLRKDSEMRKQMIATGLAVALMAVLAAAGCGGGDDSGSDEVSASAGAPYDITIGDWVVYDEARKTAVLKAYVADTPSCNAELEDRRFLLTIAAVSTDFDSATPLPDVVKKYC